MKEQPLTLREPTLQRFISGDCTRFRRPAGGIYSSLEPGQKLWIREPYYLKREYDRFSPTAADTLGARPYFATDIGPGEVERLQLGYRRFARNLLRCWYRQHAVVETIEQQRVQDITLAEAQAEGFPTVEAWAERWDLDTNSFGRPRRFADNPTVLVLTLRRIEGTLPAEARLHAPKKERAIA